MRVTWGAGTTQYDGKANGGDPGGVPPSTYRGAGPGRCKDDATTASSGPQNSVTVVVNGAKGSLSGTAHSYVGQHSTSLANAQSFNKIDRDFKVRKGLIDWILDLLGLGKKFSIGLDLYASQEFKTGTGDIRGIARILGAGISPGIEHHFEIKMNPNDSAKIDITRDGTPWKTEDTPDTFID